MEPRRWVKVGVLALALPAAALAAARGTGCGVAEAIFPQRRIDAWPLAYDLGSAGPARRVYGDLPGPARAQYYMLVAEEGDRIRVVLSVPAREHARGLRLRLALSGPGLPREGRLKWIRALPGEGMLLSRQAGPQRARGDGLSQVPYQVQQVLDTRAPALGRYVLTVYRERGEGGEYRLVLDGACVVEPETLLRLPLEWFQANYRVWPAWAIARVVVVALAVGGLIGLLYLGWQQRVTRRGGFVG